MSDVTMFFIAQSLIIIGAIVTGYVRTHVAIARLDEKTSAVREHTRGLKSDHKYLATKVDGISRHVARLEAKLEKL